MKFTKTNPDGTKEEVSEEEFQKAMEKSNGNFTVKRVFVDSETGEEKRDLFWERMGAEDDDPDSLLQLAVAYLEGDGVDQDDKIGAQLMEKAAELDLSNAQYSLGMMYGQGRGVDRDFSKVRYWMERAEENGDEDARGIIQQVDNAEKIEEMAKTGDPAAMGAWANLLMGFHSDANFNECIDYAEKAWKAGDLRGGYVLGLAHEHGRGVETDIKKATELYKQGAELGYAPSQWNYAVALFTGAGIHKSAKKAFEWALKAAEQGNLLAMNGVAHCYEQGLGVKEDSDKSIEWFEKVLEKDPVNVDALHALALAYMDDSSDAEMLNKSMELFKRAADLGDDMCNQQYTLWTYVMKFNNGIIPDDFDMMAFFQETAEKAENGDEEAENVMMTCFA